MFLEVCPGGLLLVSGKVLYDYIRAVGYVELIDTDKIKLNAPTNFNF